MKILYGKILILALVTNSLLALTAYAEGPSPYVGQEMRGIKALSQSEIDGYLDGQGMGFAKAAELNHFPGPRHVLDLSGELGLTNEQQTRTREIYSSMREEAVSLGSSLVEKERELDQFFADGSIDDNSLKAALNEIGLIRAGLRHVHLSAHLKQRELLTLHQIKLYDQLRGYGAGNHHRQNHHHSH